jgi:effector-binding domain-containing protein
MMGYLVWFIVAIFIIGAGMWGIIASNVEQARYEVVQTQKDIEIRDYAPMIVAEVAVTGTREESIKKGFRVIADYIFGNNTASKKVSMTAPVIQQEAEKMAMTAPVMQQPDGEEWRVRFVMPAGYSMETLPKPINNAVNLKSMESRRFAVVRFSGFGTDSRLKQKTVALTEYIQKNNLVVISSPIYAFYNPPWTLPFFRRNEIMVEIGNH